MSICVACRKDTGDHKKGLDMCKRCKEKFRRVLSGNYKRR